MEWPLAAVIITFLVMVIGGLVVVAWVYAKYADKDIDRTRD